MGLASIFIDINKWFIDRGHSSVVTLFFWKLDPHPPPRNANNIEYYTFVTLFSRKSDTPHPHLRYVTLEWPHINKSFIDINKWIIDINKDGPGMTDAISIKMDAD